MKPPQSLAGYIRQHLTELENRLEVGVRQEVIVSELEAYGYKTTLKGFRNFLYRARLRAAQKSAAIPTSTTIKESKSHVEKEEKFKDKEVEKSITVTTHRPTDLDAINEQRIDLKALAKLGRMEQK